MEQWNSKSPSEREEIIKKINSKLGTSFGLSNAKSRWEKITTSALKNEIEKSFSEKIISTKSIIQSIKSVIQENHDMEDLDSSDNFISDLGLDKISIVEIIMATEHKYEIAIDDEDVEKILTIADLANLVIRNIAKEKPVLRKEETAKKKPGKVKFLKVDSDIVEEIKEEPKAVEETVESYSDELDLCISFDDTGSMYTIRSQVRSNINSLVDRLFDDIPKLRIGIIIHNDYCDSPRHIFVQDFTSDKEKIKKFVNQNSPCGGGDAPECYELALHEASKLSWKSDRRALVMIGDEVPHQVGYRYGSFVNNLDWKKETEALNAMDVKIYGVQALGRRSSTFFYDGISKMTGGIKLDLSQFQHIPTYINAIAYHQSGQLETYRASDPSFNTNFALKNMFSKLSGGMGTIDSEKLELLSKFQVLKVETDGEMSIRDFVLNNGLTFSKGKGYYQLIERTSDGKANSEIIQADKEVLFVDKETGETIADTYWCREKLGVPYGSKATVRPLSIPHIMDKYEIFIQSNSVNRKLDPGVKFLYELDHH